MIDRETIINGCEKWVKNHKGEQLLLEYSAVENLLAVLKEQEHKDRMFHALEDDWKRLNELLKEQETKLCDRCGRRRLKSSREGR